MEKMVTEEKQLAQTETELDSQMALKLMNHAMFQLYPLIIVGNLTRNTYYMLTYQNFTSTECAAAGSFDDLIESGASTMHDMDKELFRKTFSRENLLKEYGQGADKVELRVFQNGDDGKLRKVEIVDFFVRDSKTQDLLVISFNRNI